MKKNRFFLLLLLLAGLWLPAKAETVMKVNYWSANQMVTEEFALDGTSAIFDNNQGMQVNFGASRLVMGFAIADVVSIKFGEPEPTGVSTTMAATGSPKPTYRNHTLGVEPGGSQPGSMSMLLCSADGRTITSNPAWDGSPIDVSSLPRGVYIFKVNNNTIKFTR